MAQAPKKLLEQMRDALRLKYYALRTEMTSLDWVRRFILFHGKCHPATLGAPEITAFLTHLAVDGACHCLHPKPGAQSAALPLSSRAADRPGRVARLVRATKPSRLPTVLTTADVQAVLRPLGEKTRPRQALRFGTRHVAIIHHDAGALFPDLPKVRRHLQPRGPLACCRRPGVEAEHARYPGVVGVFAAPVRRASRPATRHPLPPPRHLAGQRAPRRRPDGIGMAMGRACRVGASLRPRGGLALSAWGKLQRWRCEVTLRAPPELFA